jgi:hypothetical protein
VEKCYEEVVNAERLRKDRNRKPEACAAIGSDLSREMCCPQSAVARKNEKQFGKDLKFDRDLKFEFFSYHIISYHIMPRGRRSQESLSARRQQNAARNCRNRAEETPEEREHRLARHRELQREQRENETPEQRERRLAWQREYQMRYRQRQNEEEENDVRGALPREKHGFHMEREEPERRTIQQDDES